MFADIRQHNYNLKQKYQKYFERVRGWQLHNKDGGPYNKFHFVKQINIVFSKEKIEKTFIR